jgi:hypothetical protein
MLMVVFLVGILLAAVSVFVILVVQLTRHAQERTAVPVEDIKALEPVDIVDPRIAAYETEIRELKKSMEDFCRQASHQEQGLSGVLNDLRIENEGIKEARAAVRQDHEETDRLLVENAAYKAQYNEVSVELCQLKEDEARLETENMGLRSSSELVVNATIGSQKLLQTAKEEYRRQLEGFYQQIEQLQTDNVRLAEQALSVVQVEPLRKEVDAFLSRVRELETENMILMEKNNYFQYELTKSRAQVVGLERLCENMRVARSQDVQGVNEGIEAFTH